MDRRGDSRAVANASKLDARSIGRANQQACNHNFISSLPWALSGTVQKRAQQALQVCGRKAIQHTASAQHRPNEASRRLLRYNYLPAVAAKVAAASFSLSAEAWHTTPRVVREGLVAVVARVASFIVARVLTDEGVYLTCCYNEYINVLLARSTKVDWRTELEYCLMGIQLSLTMGKSVGPRAGVSR